MEPYRISSIAFRFIAGMRLGAMACFIIAFPAMAQQGDKGTLTSEFEKMSPKERARVAREEQAAASNDPAYQAAMAQAEQNFQKGDYDAAMASYGEARRLRPLNVYPKVKMEDLRVLIQQRELKAAADSAATSTPPPTATADSAPASPPPQEAVSTAPMPLPEEVPVKTVPVSSEPKPIKRDPAHATSTPPPKTVQPRAVVAPPPSAPALPDGTTENRYKQGNADVTEITVTEHGRTTVYKRVVHKWGQIYYFEDGQAIDGRVWTDRFGDKR